MTVIAHAGQLGPDELVVLGGAAVVLWLAVRARRFR
jgi:hypothetical protein